MGFGETLFGGRDKVSLLTGQQSKLLKNISKMARNNLGQGIDPYTGDISPGSNQEIQTAISGMYNALNPDQGRTDAINQLMSGAGDPEGVRQFYEQSVLAPSQQAFGDALRVVDDRYGDAWGTSGAHMRAVGDATSNFGIGIGSVLGDLVYQDRNAARDRQFGGVQASLADSQNTQGLLGNLFGAGDYQRGIQADQNAEALAKWEQAQAYNNPWLGLLAPALGTQAFGYGEQSGLLQKAQALNSTRKAFEPLGGLGG